MTSISKTTIWLMIYLQLLVTSTARAATSTGLLGDIKEKTVETGKAAGFDVKRDIRESIAIMIKGLLGFLGILSTIMDDVGIFDFFYDKQYILMIYGALLFTIAYFQFSAKQKYRKIYKEFKNEPRGRRIVGNILATLYFFGSIGFMMWIDKLVRILIR